MFPRSFALAALILAGLTIHAGARPIEIVNPSFESPALTPGAYTHYSNDDSQNIPGWKSAGGWQGVQNCVGNYETVPNGVNFAFNDGGTISQVVCGVEAGTYKLTVAIGSRPGEAGQAINGAIQLRAGDTVLKSQALTEPSKGAFEDETLTCTVPNGDPNLGKPLSIALVAGTADAKAGASKVDFDQVRLDFVSDGETDATTIHSVTVCEPYMVVNPDMPSSGDTWAPAWTADGTVFSPANDTEGFGKPHTSNIDFNRIDGKSPEALVGATINWMLPYGGGTEKLADGCTWKSGGCLAIDGALYWTIARHKYGEESGDPLRRQPGHNGSIIKSTDNGIHWTRSEQENYDHPMFPGGRFACGYFVSYGQDGHLALADGSDKYVYATSNNGFWDNGDDVILGRVPRSKIGNLSGADWQFYTGGDGSTDSSWDASFDKAAKIIDDKDHCGETGAVYLPRQKCYLMIEWFYPGGGGKMPDASTKTTWNFLTAQHPWGPWKSVGTHDFSPQAYYCPEICPKFTSADGRKLYVFTAGFWGNGAVYRLTVVPIALQ